jgi:hypothetical protein
MGAISLYGVNYVLTNAFTPTNPVTMYLALLTAQPTLNADGSSLIEPSASYSYARKPYNLQSSNWTLNQGSVSNTNPIYFDMAYSADWGTIVGWALVDSATLGSGNVYACGSVQQPMTVTQNTFVIIPANSITIGIA